MESFILRQIFMSCPQRCSVITAVWREELETFVLWFAAEPAYPTINRWLHFIQWSCSKLKIGSSHCPVQTFQRQPIVFNNKSRLLNMDVTLQIWPWKSLQLNLLPVRLVSNPFPAQFHSVARLYLSVDFSCLDVLPQIQCPLILPTILYGRWNKYFYLQYHSGNWRGLEKSSDLPKVTKLRNDKTVTKIPFEV